MALSLTRIGSERARAPRDIASVSRQRIRSHPDIWFFASAIRLRYRLFLAFREIGALTIELRSALAGILSLCAANKKAASVEAALLEQVKLDAGARNQRYLPFDLAHLPLTEGRSEHDKE